MNQYGKGVEKIPRQEHVEEWVNLLTEAKRIGLTIEEVRNFLHNFNKTTNEHH